MVTIHKSTEPAAPRRRPVAARRRPARFEEPSGPLHIDEISARYPGEWVLLRVSDGDERDALMYGEVLAHGKSRKRLSKHVIRAHQENPDQLLSVFPSGLHVPTQEQWREELAEAVRLGPADLNGWG